SSMGPTTRTCGSAASGPRRRLSSRASRRPQNENAGPKAGVEIRSGRVLSVELETSERPGEIGADGALHAPRLQRDGAARAADQPVGAEADAEAGFGRATDIAAGNGIAADVAGRGGED